MNCFKQVKRAYLIILVFHNYVGETKKVFGLVDLRQLNYTSRQAVNIVLSLIFLKTKGKISLSIPSQCNRVLRAT